MLRIVIFVLMSLLLTATLMADPSTEMRQARNRQDRAALDQLIGKLKGQPKADYNLALAYSYAAELAMEQRDKHKAQDYAEAGIPVAQKALETNPNDAKTHRILGELCAQVIPANPLLGGLKYGQCARDEVNKAIQLDGNSALAYLSRGVGNYYLPSSFGGGIEPALKDLDKAISLDPNLSDAYLWKGIALRKANRNAEAHQAIAKAVQLSPDWIWAKEQLQKTPAQ
jgi:tetratricopeptide (TPR) repeat protein